MSFLNLGVRHKMNLLKLRLMPSYAAEVANTYWSNAEHFHGVGGESDDAYTMYSKHIVKLIEDNGYDLKTCNVLDYGAGDGKLTLKIMQHCKQIEACEISQTLVKKINDIGIKCIHVNELFSQRYDVIYSNGAIFYIHPTVIVDKLKSLTKLLKGHD